MQLINLGCGKCLRLGWVNVDFHTKSQGVLAYDLRLGIPFADDSFDVVYHSHLLEHFSRSQAAFFLRECYRVLKPGGILRVVVPDLENITRAYLAALEAAIDSPENCDALERHEWMQIELLDQMTRTASGGEMLDYLKQDPVPQKEFIWGRLGQEARRIMGGVDHDPHQPPACRMAQEAIEPEFFNTGELHRWMYDCVSLATLLKKNGFSSVCRQEFNTSHSAEILRQDLDSGVDGSIRKPDSLFMEGIKPSSTYSDSPRIVLFSTADSGGAGIAAQRLHGALRDLHINSALYVLHQKFCNEGIHVVPSYNHTIKPSGPTSSESSAAAIGALYRQRALNEYHNIPKGCEYFSVPFQFGAFSSVPKLDDFDIVHLHWIAGMTDPSLAVEYLRGRPVIWTLHDMNPFTGGCHYADGCDGFEKRCGNCPQLGSQKADDLSRKTWILRMGAYRQLNLHIVAPSRWLAEKTKKSTLLSRFPVHVIPNGHPLDTYTPMNRESIREALGLAPENLVLLFASQDLTNRRKGGAFLLQILHKLAASPLKSKICVLLLGHNPAPPFLETGINIQSTGHIDDTHSMAILYNAADAVLVPSLEDNQPNVICEAQACGTPVIAFASGGIPEMILHKETGFLAETGDSQGLLEGILWADAARTMPTIRRLCRAHAIELWHPQKCAQRYAQLYSSICKSSNASNLKASQN